MGLVHDVCHQLSKSLARAVLDYRVIDAHHLIEDGPALVCANHVSYLDPPLVGIAFSRPIHYLARRTLYSNSFARWLFPKLNVVPIDQDRAGFAGLKTMIRLLQEGKRVLIFPEGSRSPDGKPQPAQPGTGLVVARARVPVVPIRLFGAHEALPVGAAGLQPRSVTAVAGPPLRFDLEPIPEGKDAYQEISTRIMNAIAALDCPADRIPEPRRS